MKKLLTILLLALSFSAGATSIIYDGLRCELEPTEPFSPARVVFEVVEDLGDGNYKLRLTGGSLAFKDQICISSLGELSDETTDFKIIRVFEREASAYFSGSLLVITYAIISQIGDVANDGIIFSSGITAPINTTLVFEYNNSRQSFNLKTATHQLGHIHFLAIPELMTNIQTILTGSAEINNITESIEFFITND